MFYVGFAMIFFLAVLSCLPVSAPGWIADAAFAI